MNLRRSLISGLIAISAFAQPANAQVGLDLPKDTLFENPEYQYNWKVDAPLR